MVELKGLHGFEEMFSLCLVEGIVENVPSMLGKCWKVAVKKEAEHLEQLARNSSIIQFVQIMGVVPEYRLALDG